MSEKAEKKSEAAPPADKGKEAAGHEKKAGGGLLTKLPVLLGGVMIIEAAVLFAGFKFLGGGAPKVAAGAELSNPDKAVPAGEGKEGAKNLAPDDPNKSVEIPVLDFQSPNKANGRTYLYDVSIYVVTKLLVQDKVKAIIADREALIKDRIRTIIAQSDPEKLGGGSEPGLETFRRQVKYQLDEIVGDGLIDDVLVPKCIPTRSDF
jgi:flagellar basal body-associated protein FliL